MASASSQQWARALYQGTYKSFPVQDDRHFLLVARYVERNALRARLVRKAENWPWSSLWRRRKGSSSDERAILSQWPVRRPSDWLTWVNEPQSAKELTGLRESLVRGRPFGDPQWQASAARRLDLEHTFRPRGRPPKPRDKATEEAGRQEAVPE